MKYLFILISTVTLIGCAQTKLNQVEDQPNKQGLAGEAAPSKEAKVTQEEKIPRSIAVTDIAFKKELKDSFYFEGATTTRESRSSSDNKDLSDKQNREGFDPSTSKPDALPEALGETKESVAEEPNVVVASPPTKTNIEQLTKNSASSSSEDIKSVKNFGAKRNMALYGELRGLAGPIRALLIKSGYKVVPSKPASAVSEDNDQFLDVVKRIKEGEYGPADFVLYGVLTEISPVTGKEKIQGTDTHMLIKGLDITVDFSLIDTQSLQVVAAFSAHGSGSDNRLSTKESEYVASNAKILRQMAVSLAEDAAVHLADQKFIKGSAIVSQNPKRRLDDDSTSLKVYKK